jgi:hypothetical protein
MVKKKNEGSLIVKMLASGLFALLTVLAASGQNKPVMTVKPDDPLFGTWVNKEYEGGKNFLAVKAVIFPECKEWDYFKMSDTKPIYEGRFTIVEAWVDEEGSHWYRTKGGSDYYPWPSKEPQWKGYGLTRINAAGTVMEGVSRESGYPEEISELAGAYAIYYKQQ